MPGACRRCRRRRRDRRPGACAGRRPARQAVVVIDRDAQANGASIRNFGFVTVTGQQRGECWRRAHALARRLGRGGAEGRDPRSSSAASLIGRAPARGAWRCSRPSWPPRWARAASCWRPSRRANACPMLAPGAFAGALWSPHELRVESREAIPQLAAWLARAHRASRSCARRPSARSRRRRLETSRGHDRGRGRASSAPATISSRLFPERIAAYGLTRCKLHMLRAARRSARLRACPAR